MSTYWNFREILNISPEAESFGCVGTRPEDSTRCGNRRPLLSELNLAKASELLDTMDQCESLKASYDYLDELAHLTICIAHSESENDQVTQISGRWIDMIIQHMRKEIMTSPRPKTRRGHTRPRESSFTTPSLAALDEEKEEQIHSPIPLMNKRTSIIRESSLTRQSSTSSNYSNGSAGSIGTTGSKRGRKLSSKITNLISEVGFHDEANEMYSPIEAPAPFRSVSRARSADTTSTPRMKRKDTTMSLPIEENSREEEWAAEQLNSLLAKPHPLLQSAHQSPRQAEEENKELIRKSIVETIAAQPPTIKRPVPRSRSSTMSSNASTGSTASSAASAASSKTSHADSVTASSPPSSRSSSAKTSPELGAIDGKHSTFKPSNSKSQSIAPPTVKLATPSTKSPEAGPLPNFDFGIYANLPLPPGYKQGLSPVKEKFPDVELESDYKLPPKTFQMDESRPSYSIKDMEKPMPTEEVVVKLVEEQMPQTEPIKQLEKQLPMEPVAEQLERPKNPIAKQLERPTMEAPRPTVSDECAVESDDESRDVATEIHTPELSKSNTIDSSSSSGLPEHETVVPIGTSWISSIAPNSQASSRRASRRLSRAPSVSRRLSRTLSRTISRRSSRASSFGINDESKQADLVPLEKLIKMSYALADRLDGLDAPGRVEVQAPIRPTRYKYTLPSSSRAVVQQPLPEIRYSRLFMTSLDPDSFPYAKPSFTVPEPLKVEKTDKRSEKRSEKKSDKKVDKKVEKPRQQSVPRKPVLEHRTSGAPSVYSANGKEVRTSPQQTQTQPQPQSATRPPLRPRVGTGKEVFSPLAPPPSMPALRWETPYSIPRVSQQQQPQQQPMYKCFPPPQLGGPAQTFEGMRVPTQTHMIRPDVDVDGEVCPICGDRQGILWKCDCEGRRKGMRGQAKRENSGYGGRGASVRRGTMRRFRRRVARAFSTV